MNNRQKSLHALLILYANGLSKAQLCNILKIDNRELDELATSLQESLENSGVELIDTVSSLQIVVNTKFLPKKLPENKPEAETLTAPAMEVLTIIAYKQPITAAEIEQVRGINSDQTIKGLIERELIAETKSKKAGINFSSYHTTNKFLQICGIKSLSELPKI